MVISGKNWKAMRVHPDKTRVLMVGDRYETDIIGARRFGWDTAWLSPDVPEDLTPPTYHRTDIRQLPGLLLGS